jgi:hypothetical protein
VDVHQAVQEDELVAAIHARAEAFDPRAELAFSYLQVCARVGGGRGPVLTCRGRGRRMNRFGAPGAAAAGRPLWWACAGPLLWCCACLAELCSAALLDMPGTAGVLRHLRHVCPRCRRGGVYDRTPGRHLAGGAARLRSSSRAPPAALGAPLHAWGLRCAGSPSSLIGCVVLHDDRNKNNGRRRRRRRRRRSSSSP